MDRRRDKLGDYVMYAEGFNRYEEFATAARSFATLYEDSPENDSEHPGEFDLYLEPGGGNERRVVVHSDHVYGKNRQVDRLCIDVYGGDSTAAYADKDFVAPVGLAWFYIEVRPIKVDFAPASLTWDEAYVDGAGGGSMGLFDSATQGDEGNLGAMFRSIWGIDPLGENQFHVVVYFPTWLTLKTSNLSTWNDYDAIYGWEFRFNCSNDPIDEARFQADLVGIPPVGYVILS